MNLMLRVADTSSKTGNMAIAQFAAVLSVSCVGAFGGITAGSVGVGAFGGITAASVGVGAFGGITAAGVGNVITGNSGASNVV